LILTRAREDWRAHHAVAEDIMTTTPRLWKSQTQVNTSNEPVPGSGGSARQYDGQIAPLQDGGYVVAWVDESRTHSPFGIAVVGQRYDAAGNKVGGEVKLSQFASGTQWEPAVTVFPNGNIAVAYVDLLSGDNDIYVHIYSSSLNFIRSDEIDVGTAQTVNPSLTAFADGSYVVSYTIGSGADTDIVARRVSATGAVGSQFDIDNQTDNRGVSELETLSNGNFVAVYQDEHNGSSTDTDILFKVFTAAGAPVAGVGGTVAGGGGTERETDPDVAALRGGGFAVVWTDFVSSTPGSTKSDIRASILSDTGDYIAYDIPVNTTTAGNHDEASVVALADGGFLITWEDDGAGLVRAQRFDALGNKIDAEFTVQNVIENFLEQAGLQAAVLTDGRIAFAIGDPNVDNDVTTSIRTTAGLNGTPLADVLNGSAGPDSMSGGLGNDEYYVYEPGDAVIENAGEGMDRVSAFTHFTLPDNVENLDLLGVADLQGYGNGVANVINGNAGNNLIDGRGGADVMRGEDGNDVYIVDDAGDQVTENAGEGTDLVFATAHFALSSDVENLILQGNADLQGYGNDLANTIVGNAGNNLLDGRGGADAMTGGAGNDSYFVDDAGDTVTESVGEGTDAVFSTAHFALSANVETLVLQGIADLQGYGNTLANTLYGNAGSNLLDGRGGADLMRGGAGNDTYFVDDAGDQVIEGAGQGTDAVFSTAHFVLPTNVETLVLQGNADLQGYGNTLANTLYGNAGSNLLDGRGGADIMRGGAGNDTYFVDDAGDVIVENLNEGTDAVFSTAHFALSANVETLVLQGNADLQGYGNTLANMLYGNAGSNLLDGRGGADVMAGGAGNDTYFVDDAGDMVIENPNEGTDAVFATVDHALAANVETLVLQGMGNLSGIGNSLANSIYGNAGDNTLNGRAGADLLTGNAGNDTFVFNAGQGNGDTVVDFAGNGGAAGDALQFVGYGAGASFTNVDATHWQVNYNGGTAHDVITFMNGAAIDSTDVLFV
jgi:Ca2+-binding RTX toxin-like protein